MFFENFQFTDFLISITFILFVYVFQFYYKYFTRPNPLPGPLPLPFFQNELDFKGDVREFNMSLKKKYGGICEVYLGGHRRIMLSRPEDIEKIFSTSIKHTTFSARTHQAQGLKELNVLNKGLLFNNDLKNWRFNRQFFTQAILTPSFKNDAVFWSCKLFEELETYWKSIANNISSDEREWTLEVDFSQWFHRFSYDMIVTLTTGERSYSMASYYNSLNTNKVQLPNELIENSNKFINEIRNHALGVTIFMSISSFMRHYNPLIKKKATSLLKNRDNLFKRLDDIIKRRRKEIEESPNNIKLRNDMLTYLVTANTHRNSNKIKTIENEEVRPMTDEEIRINLLDAFVNGTDTSANLFCFITYYLCHNPKVKQRVLAEIDKYFPSITPNNITHENLFKLKFCEAVIMETNRLTPAVNSITRYSTDTCEIAGYKWEKGQYFSINIISLHLHEDYWDNPEVFNPDRFYHNSDINKINNDIIDIDDTIMSKNNFSYTIFGGGLRICPGRKLAMIELLSLMTLVYGNYDFELSNMNEDLKIKSAAITACQELKVIIKPRKKV
ncbi:cytochrome P450 [Gigaspora margarita]|uniref:Cytochrome P450 n=1 Tax=Gigaspora margarita TaxID=4874 RepID=A0A8H4ARX0_GIGMA|nr:cytochrome P450 [Gigaspora margarita]